MSKTPAPHTISADRLVDSSDRLLRLVEGKEVLYGIALTTSALTHATLALRAEQRTANLIAWAAHQQTRNIRTDDLNDIIENRLGL